MKLNTRAHTAIVAIVLGVAVVVGVLTMYTQNGQVLPGSATGEATKADQRAPMPSGPAATNANR